MAAAGCQIAEPSFNSDIASSPMAVSSSPPAPTGRTPQRSHSQPPSGDARMLLDDIAASIIPQRYRPPAQRVGDVERKDEPDDELREMAQEHSRRGRLESGQAQQRAGQHRRLCPPFHPDERRQQQGRRRQQGDYHGRAPSDGGPLTGGPIIRHSSSDSTSAAPNRSNRGIRPAASRAAGSRPGTASAPMTSASSASGMRPAYTAGQSNRCTSGPAARVEAPSPGPGSPR